jgi:hypothetical protein
VFQAYLTTFLIEPGYEEPIKTVEQMLNSKMNFGFIFFYEDMFLDTSDTVDSALFENAVECPDEPTCFMWASKYHNISTILNDLNVEMYRVMGIWTDENIRPFLCELEDGVVRTLDCAIVVEYRSPIFEFINDVISHIVEGGIFMHIKKMGFERAKIQTKFNFPSANDKYSVYSVSHLQTAFCLLMLGYVLAVACFVTEIMCHCYRSKGRERTSTALCHRHT